MVLAIIYLLIAVFLWGISSIKQQSLKSIIESNREIRKMDKEILSIKSEIKAIKNLSMVEDKLIADAIKGLK